MSFRVLLPMSIYLFSACANRGLVGCMYYHPRTFSISYDLSARFLAVEQYFNLTHMSTASLWINYLCDICSVQSASRGLSDNPRGSLFQCNLGHREQDPNAGILSFSIVHHEMQLLVGVLCSLASAASAAAPACRVVSTAARTP